MVIVMNYLCSLFAIPFAWPDPSRCHDGFLNGRHRIMLVVARHEHRAFHERRCGDEAVVELQGVRFYRPLVRSRFLGYLPRYIHDDEAVEQFAGPGALRAREATLRYRIPSPGTVLRPGHITRPLTGDRWPDRVALPPPLTGGR